MKKLELKQMEIMSGGINGRNCFLLGAGGAITLLIPGGGWMVSAGLWGTAASGDCF